MQAYKDSLRALDERVCRGVGGENDEKNRSFDDLRKLYRDCHSTVADAAEEAAEAAAAAAAAPVTPVARPPRPPSPEEPLFDVDFVLGRLHAEGRSLPGVAPSPAPAGVLGEATRMETEDTLASAMGKVVVSPPRARAPESCVRGEASLGVFAPGVLVAVLVAAIAVREVGLLQSARRRRRETRSLAS